MNPRLAVARVATSTPSPCHDLGRTDRDGNRAMLHEGPHPQAELKLDTKTVRRLFAESEKQWQVLVLRQFLPTWKPSPMPLAVLVASTASRIKLRHPPWIPRV